MIYSRGCWPEAVVILQGVSNNGLSNPWSEVWTTWESDNRRSSKIVLFLNNLNINTTSRDRPTRLEWAKSDTFVEAQER